MKPAFTDLGIVLCQKKFVEADRLVHLLSYKHGKITLIAKGVRRTTSKKSGHLDSLNLVKFHTSRGKQLQNLSQAETVDSFRLLKADLVRTKAALFVAELIDNLVAEDSPDPALFLSLKNFLISLESVSEDKIKPLLIKFQLFFIRRLGYPLPDSQDQADLTGYLEDLIQKRLVSPRI